MLGREKIRRIDNLLIEPTGIEIRLVEFGLADDYLLIEPTGIEILIFPGNEINITPSN